MKIERPHWLSAVVIIVLLQVSALGAQTLNSSNVETLPSKGSSDLPTCWDQSSKPLTKARPNTAHPVTRKVLPTQYGSAEGTITWQFNRIVGTKADTGADLMLLLKNVKLASTDLAILRNPTLAAFGGCVKKYHIFYAVADGYGKLNFDNLPVGDYHGILHSSNTARNFQVPLSDDDLDMFRSFISGDVSQVEITRRLSTRNFGFVFFTIRPNGLTHFSHDFGNTYI